MKVCTLDLPRQGRTKKPQNKTTKRRVNSEAVDSTQKKNSQ